MASACAGVSSASVSVRAILSVSSILEIYSLALARNVEFWTEGDVRVTLTSPGRLYGPLSASTGNFHKKL